MTATIRGGRSLSRASSKTAYCIFLSCCSGNITHITIAVYFHFHIVQIFRRHRISYKFLAVPFGPLCASQFILAAHIVGRQVYIKSWSNHCLIVHRVRLELDRNFPIVSAWLFCSTSDCCAVVRPHEPRWKGKHTRDGFKHVKHPIFTIATRWLIFVRSWVQWHSDDNCLLFMCLGESALPVSDQ